MYGSTQTSSYYKAVEVPPSTNKSRGYNVTPNVQLSKLISGYTGSRKIMYLHNILTREDSELVKRIYTAQRNNPTNGYFVEMVSSDLELIDETLDESKTRI